MSGDAGADGGADAGTDGGASDAGADGGNADGGGQDAGAQDGGSDAGAQDGGDAGSGADAGADGGSQDGGSDAGAPDAGSDAGPTTGTITLISPIPNAAIGVHELLVSAVATAPGGASPVYFYLSQDMRTLASIELMGDGSGNFSATFPLAGTGIHDGPATVSSIAYWTANGVTQHTDSAPVEVFVDGDAPAVRSVETDAPWYSSVASPAQTAFVSVGIFDVGPAGVSTGAVLETAAGKSYVAATIPDGGTGTYVFAVPVADLLVDAGEVAAINFEILANDLVDNDAAIDGGTIFIDNVPPVFANPVVGNGFYSGDAGISFSIDIADPDGGSGLLAASANLTLPSGAVLTTPAISGNTFTFSLTGSDLQPFGQQGPAPLGLVSVKDVAGNSSTIDAGTVLIDRAPPMIGALQIGDGSGAWAARDATGAGTVAVAVSVDDGASGSGVASAALIVPGSSGPVTVAPASMAASGTAIIYTFQVPTSVQAAGSVAPISFQLEALDAVGNQQGPATAMSGINVALLLIDDTPPSVGSPALATTADATISGTPWFNQTGGEIEIDVVMSDTGSGLDPASFQLVDGAGQQQDDASNPLDGTLKDPATGTYQFFVKRAGGPIAAGAQGTVSLTATARDRVVHQTTSSGLSFGIDGQPPAISFASAVPLSATAAVSYPSNDCASGTNGLQSGDLCGHDGHHFYRKTETQKVSFYVNDASSGAGLATDVSTVVSCTIAGAPGVDCLGAGGPNNLTAYVSTDGNGSVKYQFVPDFSTAAFASNATGNGTVDLKIVVQDRVGNQSTLDTSAHSNAVAVTRLKWARALRSAFFNSMCCRPIYTTLPTPQIILGGSYSGNTSDAELVGLDPTGLVLWDLESVFRGTAFSPPNALAYSSQTNLLYKTSSSSLTAFKLTSTGLSGYASLIGLSSPSGIAILEGSSAEYATTALSNSAVVETATCTPAANGGTCSGAQTRASGSFSGTTVIPTTDGANIYLGVTGSNPTGSGGGLIKMTFNPATGVVASGTTASGINRVLSSVAIAGSLFFANDVSSTTGFDAFGPSTLAEISGWTRPLDPQNIFGTYTQQLVTGTYVLAGYEGGVLHGLSPTSGASQFQISNVNSLVAVSSDQNLYYVSGTAGLTATTISAGTTTNTWTFSGASTSAGTLAIATSGVGEVIDGNGVLYVNDNNQNVFAVITDSPGPMPSTAGSTWPIRGFDNCASANSSYVCR